MAADAPTATASGSLAKAPARVAPSASTPSIETLSDTWRLRTSFMQHALRAISALASDPSTVAEYLRARDPNGLLAMGEASLDALSALALKPGFPPAFRDGMRAIATVRADLLRPLTAACNELGRRHAAVVELDLPEGALEGFLRGASDVVLSDGPSAAGAVTGAVLGHALLPGFGGVIGGAIGGWLGGQKSQRKQQEALDALEAAWSKGVDTLDPMLDQAWDVAVEAALRSGLSLQDSSFCNRGELAWRELAERLQSTSGTPHPLHSEVRAFLARWGPHREALVEDVRLAVPPHGDIDETTRRNVAIIESVYPNDPDGVSVIAELLMHQRQFERAIQLVSDAIAANPEHEFLPCHLICVLAGAGRNTELLAAIARYEPRLGAAAHWLHAQGLACAERHREAGAVLTRWSRSDPSWPVATVEILTHEPIFGPMYAQGLAPTPTVEAYVRALVCEQLPEEEGRSTHGIPPDTYGWKVKRFVEGKRPNEAIVYCHRAWLSPDDANCLFVITSGGVLWREMTSSPVVSLDFTNIDPDAVTSEERKLSVDGHRTRAFFDRPTCAAVADVIQRIARQLRR